MIIMIIEDKLEAGLKLQSNFLRFVLLMYMIDRINCDETFWFSLFLILVRV